MNSGFTKLYATILTSSVWSLDNATRILWITMLALSDANGFVAASLVGLAHLAHLTLPETKAALEKLEGKDEFSRTPDHEGRRIKPIDGGWLILNYAKYREPQLSTSPDAIATRERVRRFREKKAGKGNVTSPLQERYPASASASASVDVVETMSVPASPPDQAVDEIIAEWARLIGSQAPCDAHSREPVYRILEQGFSKEDCLAVLKQKWSDWGNDAKMRQHFIISTLFKPEKFGGYLALTKLSSSPIGTKPKNYHF